MARPHSVKKSLRHCTWTCPLALTRQLLGPRQHLKIIDTRGQALELNCFCCALRQWHRGNVAGITTLPVPVCPNSVQHLQPTCLENRFLPQQSKEKSTAKAQSLQRIIHHLAASCAISSSSPCHRTFRGPSPPYARR